MPTLTRRTLLKASAAVAGGFGLSAMGSMVGTALAVPDPKILETRKTTAKLINAASTRDILTYGDAGMPPVLRMTKGKTFAARLVNGLER